MNKITPHLWFDNQAKEAAHFYTSVFKDGKIISSTVLHNTPSGEVDSLVIELFGQQFMMISAGPLFKFNPSVSFLVNCNSVEEVDELWKKLSDGGKPLMDLSSEYPFSKRYGWLEDKYGLSWQLMLTDTKQSQKIVPTIMYVQEQNGNAEQAVKFYTSVFKNSKIDHIMPYGNDQVDMEGLVMHAGFNLENTQFAAMDGGTAHKFNFNEAISFIINCEDQEEIDYYWEKLSVDPSSEQCGWLKDKFGLSWQVSPNILNGMLEDKDPEKVKRVTEAFLKMKKFNIEELKKAYEGK